MDIRSPFGDRYEDLNFPGHTQVVCMREPELVKNPKQAIADALEHPISSLPLSEIARGKLAARKSRDGGHATAVLVVSDNTRPVPYKGEEGVLLPIIETLLAEGFCTSDILILIATGTHRAMTQEEIARMIDPRVLQMGIPVVNHDCREDRKSVV